MLNKFNNLENQTTTTKQATSNFYSVRKIVAGSIIVLTLAAAGLYTALRTSTGHLGIFTQASANNKNISEPIYNIVAVDEHIPNVRNHLIFLAKLAEKANRFKDVTFYMSEISKMNEELSFEERDLLFTGYRNVLNSLRSSWWTMFNLENSNNGRESSNTDTVEIEMIRAYRTTIEKEFKTIGGQFLNILEENLIPFSSKSEDTLLYLKKKGDILRYFAELEISFDNDSNSAVARSKEAYELALEIATSIGLPAEDPIRLGLILNYTVLIFENLKSAKEAYRLATAALAEASQAISTTSKEIHNETYQIMQLLRDNMAIWVTKIHDDENETHVKGL